MRLRLPIYLRVYHEGEGVGSGTGGGGNNPPPAAPWYQTAGVAQEHHEWLAGKQFADVNLAMSSYRSLEGVLGRNRLAVPSGPEDQASYDAIYKTLGRPDTHDGYALKEGSLIKADEFKAHFAPVFHKAGISAQQASVLLDAYEARGKAMEEARQAELAARETREIQELETAWASNKDANMDIASRAFRHLGISEEETAAIEEALGYKKTMEIFHKIGAGMSEAAFHQDGKPGQHGDGKNADTLQSEISAKLRDPEFKARYNHHDPRVRKSAIDEMEVLQKRLADMQEAQPPFDPTKRGTSVSEAKFGRR